MHQIYPLFYKLFKNPYFVIGGITVLGAFLRLYHLGYKSLWLDEAILYWISQGNFNEVITQNALDNSAPPLFALLISLVSQLNDTEVALRAVPCLTGVLSIPVIYFLAKQFLSQFGAYFCTLIVSISSTQIEYSQQLREYSVTFLQSILILVIFYIFLHNTTWKNFTIMLFIWNIAVFIQYGLSLLIFTLSLIFIACIILKNEKSLIVKYVIIHIFLAGSIAIVYSLSLKYQMHVGFGATLTHNYLEKAYWDGQWSSLLGFAVRNTIDVFNFAYPTITPLFIIITLVGVLNLLFTQNWLVLAMLICPMINIFIASSLRLYPYQGSRQIIFLIPMIYIAAGFGFNYLWNIDKTKLIASLWVLILVVDGLNSSYIYLNLPGNENIKPLTQLLSSSYHHGDRIYIYYGARPAFTYYYHEHATKWIHSVANREQPEAYLEQINKELSKQGRVWMVFSHCYRTECELIQTHVHKIRHVKLELTTNGASLYLVD